MPGSVRLRHIAVTFWALAGYVALESVRDLLTQDKAGESLVGIVLWLAMQLIPFSHRLPCFKT
jgi:hypothetical protein